MVTSLTTREKSVNLDQCSPVPITFIFKKREHFAPSSIGDRPSKLVVLDHISNRQILNSYQAIRTNQISSQLVQKIGTSIFNSCLYPSYFKSCFISVTRAFGFPTQFLLRYFELLIQSIKMLWIGYLFAITSTQQTRDTNINPNFLISWWQYLNGIVIYQQRNKPSTRRFEFDCNSRRTTTIWQKPRPDYWQWLFAFSKPKSIVSVLKSRLGKLSRTTITLGFKPGILSSFAPEVSKRCLVRVPLRLSAARGRIRFLQMSLTLLQRHTANFVEKVQVFGLFPASQQTRGFFVLNSFLSFIPSFGFGSQSFVVDQTYTTHCPSQEILLLGSRVKAVLVSTFSHASHYTALNVNNIIGGAHSRVAYKREHSYGGSLLCENR